MIWVRNISGGYDLTNRISNLRWANERPRGDRDASFVLHEKWGTSVPEIDKGAVIHIGDGIDVLWAGRIEEHDRGGDRDEQIAVTAYGLGVRLKDSTMQEIYVDRDLDAWGPFSVQRKINLNATLDLQDGTVQPDLTTGEPSLATRIIGAWWRAVRCEVWYYSGGIDIGSLGYAWKRGPAVLNTDTNWTWDAHLMANDLATVGESSGNLRAAGPGSGTLAAAAAGRYWAFVRLAYAIAAGSDSRNWDVFWTSLAVFGNHGLTKRGSAPNEGFYASDMVQDAADRATGITIRRIDATTFVIEQMEFKEPTIHDGAITKINETHQHERVWGTWGPDSPLDAGTDGYFDYTATEPTTAHWFAPRADCDDLDLHTELSTLFNQVQVQYQDVAGSRQTVTRTASVPELDEDGITKTATLSGGTLTTTLAQQLGDAFLALSGSFAPARGSATISRPINHKDRGALPPHYMRADGSNLRVPDILPSTTLFELTSNPDRRTLFPLKRVEVDCSGAYPTTRVELDQTNDVLAALQARLDLERQLVGV